MFEHLLKIRYVVVVIVILAVLHALAFLVMGAEVAFRSYWHVLRDRTDPGASLRPGLELLHSLDFLFVAMVFLVLALGIAKLFLIGPKAASDMELPTWLRIDSIAELKVLLWETILVTLVIAGLSELTTGLFEKLEWTALVTPLSILMLSVALYFVKRGGGQ
jgi:uncharacterized membrane protein YqhA